MSDETARGRFYPLVDARCRDHRCTEKDTYRMVGRCSNCGYGPLLLLVSARHTRPSDAQCPKCRCYRVYADRLAGDDELPESSS